MNTRKQWYFKIKTEFTIDKTTFLSVTTQEERSSCWENFRVCNQFHTWEVWSGELNFKYKARLTTVFSNILLIYTMVLIMLGVPDLKMSDCLDRFGSFYVSGQVLSVAFWSSFWAFIVHVLISWIFRFSDLEFFAFGKMYNITHKMSFICWTLLSLLISNSIIILITYGFWVPYYTCLIWLFSSVLAIIIDIVILENIFIIAQTYSCQFHLTLSLGDRFNSVLETIDYQKKVLYEKLNSSLLRPLTGHLYKPLEGLDMIKKRIVVLLRQGIYNDLQDLIMYATFNMLLHFIILYNKGSLAIFTKTQMEALIDGQLSRTQKFSTIESISGIYNYMNITLIPSVQSIEWYPNFTIDHEGMMVDNANKLVGVIRLRQHRMKPKACMAHIKMAFLKLTCFSEFSMERAETRNFYYGWSPKPNNQSSDMYRYQSAEKTHSLLEFGNIGLYSGGGYIAELDRNRNESHRELYDLSEGSWLNEQTRGLFLDFLSYNANQNLFIAIHLLIEQSASGYLANHIGVFVVRMLYVKSETETTTLVFEILFIAWLVLLMLKLTITITKNIKVFYKKWWFIIDYLINTLCVISIVIVVVRKQMVEDYLEHLNKTSHKKFKSYASLIYIEEFLTLICCALIVLATIRLWRFLRFASFFRILEQTIAMASVPLLGVTLYFAIILTAYGFAGVLIFGNQYPELSSFLRIVTTLCQLALKPDEFNMSAYTVYNIAYVYFTTYLIMMQVILNIYITVIIMAYTKAQLQLSVLPESFTIHDYFQEKLTYMPKIMRFKLRRIRGGEAMPPVTPKADEFRFANALTVTNADLLSMKFLVTCIIRNLGQTSTQRKVLTKYEAKLMLRVCQQFVLDIDQQKKELEIFFKGHFEGKKIELIDEKRITKIAEIVQMLLSNEALKTQKKYAKVDKGLKRYATAIRKKMKSLDLCVRKCKIMLTDLDGIERKITNLIKKI